MKNPTSTVTIRVDRKTRDRLQKLANVTARSKSYIAAEALRSYLEQNEWQLQALEKGIEDAEAGRTVGHKKVASWLETWGTDREGAPPDWK